MLNSIMILTEKSQCHYRQLTNTNAEMNKIMYTIIISHCDQLVSKMASDILSWR